MKQACFYTTNNLHELEVSEDTQIHNKNMQVSTDSKRDLLKKVNHLLILCLIFFCYMITSVTLHAQTPTPPANYPGHGLSSGDPYLISSLNNLYWIADQVENYGKDFDGIYFRQTANIDASATSGWTGGWLPIAGALTNFYGNYDGYGHTISNLYINRITKDSVGLFGYLGKGTIQNLGLVNANIIGLANVGGLVGYMDSGGSLSNCYTSGSVSAIDQAAGGLLGANDANSGSINQCYSSCSVTSNTYVGGLVGYDNNSTTTIINCYSTGAVSGSSIVGGLIGQLSLSQLPSNCFWDTQTSGQSSSEGGTGKTTAQMKTAATFSLAAWSASIWSLIDGSYPKLIWQVPTIQSSAIVFSSVTNTTMTVSWTIGDGGQRVLFVKGGTGAITNPTDGTTYTASSNWSSKGTQLGSSGYYCVYNGPNASVSLSNLSPATQYPVQIFEYDGSGTTSKYLTTTATNNPNNQTTLPNAPTITSISPSSGAAAGGISVVITGTNLLSASSVKFGSTNATGFTVNSATQITATSPVGSTGAVDVTVTTPGGTSTTVIGDQFTYYAASSTFQTAGNWSLASNWSAGIPGSGTEATISANCTLDGNFTTENLIISANGALTILTGNTLAVTGDLDLESDNNGTGSLINNGTLNVSGITTAQRYMIGNKWHMVSPTAAGGSISTFIQAAGNAISVNGSSQYGMMDYNETGNSWNPYFTTGTGGNLAAGKGYSLRKSANGIVAFKGTLTSGTKTVTLSKVGAEGWNCVGNPYPSAMNMNTAASAANNFLKTNAIDASNLDPSYACIYVWDEDALAYKILGNLNFGVRDLGQNVFQSGQGFFVKANNSSSSIQFTSAMQVHQTGTALKSGQLSWPGFELSVTSADVKASTVVAFNSQMTKGLDPTYDAGLLRGTSGLELYSRLVNDNGVDFAIQCLPENYNSLVIPLGVESKTGGEITFSAETVELPTACSVILEDKLTKTFTSLSGGATYKTTVSAGTTATGRFYIHTSYLTTGTSGLLPTEGFRLKAYPVDEVIWIEGQVSSLAKAWLFNINGSKLGEFNLQEGNRNNISTSGFTSGVYILKVTDGNNTFTSKLVLISNQ